MVTIEIQIPEIIWAKLILAGYSDIDIQSIFASYCQSILGFPNTILLENFDEWLSLYAQQSSK